MKENERYEIINDENKNYLTINNNSFSNNIFDKKEQKDVPKFSDILSISSNPEEIFTLLYPIGHGGFGTVYKAIHNETKTIYAIKIINFIHNLKNKSVNNIDIQNNFQNLFYNLNYSSAQQESSLMKLCHKSKYIVNYYGSYYSKKTNTLWLILEYCPPGSIIDLMLSMNRAYSEQEISTIMKNVLKGLIFIHSKNLIHRDIKAANIFLTEDGFAKLGDFGVGVKLGTGVLFRNSKKGSPYWMSPQVVNKLDYDMKTDIWSLGITCSEMCNGEPPFAELNPQNVMEKIGNQPPNVDEIIKKEEHTEEFYDFVKKCLEIDPEKRPSAKELIKHEFIVKYAKDNNIIKELINKHKEDIYKFRKFSNEMNNNKDDKSDFFDIKEEKLDIEDNSFCSKKPHHERNNDSNITSHFYDDIQTNNYKEKENLLIKMISNSSNSNNLINSTKDSQNQIKEDKNNIPPKRDYKNFPTFHKIEDENNINDDSDSVEVQEIHNLCKSFDTNYFFNENQNQKKIEKNTNICQKNKKKNVNKIKLSKTNEIFPKPNLIKEKINLLFDKNDNKLENNKDNSNMNKIIYNKKTRNKNINNIFSNKNKLKSRNIINKSFDNLYNKKNKSNINEKTNYIYVKSRIIKREKNNLIFKKPIISSKRKNNNFIFCKTIKNNNNILLESEDEEGHINKTILFDTKSNFDLLKNTKIHNFSKTNYCFYKNVLRLEEIKIYKNENYTNNNTEIVNDI